MIKHPAVLEAAVVGIPDAIKGRTPKAFVVLRDNTQSSPELEKAIREFANEKLAGTHRIHHLEIRLYLPKTVSGKIQRAVLRKEEEDKTSSQIKTNGL